MDGTLQLVPDGLVDHLLSLHGTLSFELVRDNLDGNVRSIGIIVGSRDLDLGSLEGFTNLFGAGIDDRGVGLGTHEAGSTGSRSDESRPGMSRHGGKGSRPERRQHAEEKERKKEKKMASSAGGRAHGNVLNDRQQDFCKCVGR